MILKDKYNRLHNYLRISLTEACNFHCIYCNPKESHKLSHSEPDILNFDEIERIIKIFLGLGFNKIRFTGGEPLARKNVGQLFERIKKLKEIFSFELSITTNGTLINGNLGELKANGLDRINFSLDSLNRQTFENITGRDKLDAVLKSIKDTSAAGYETTKINTVIMKGINDNEILDFCQFSIDNKVNVRFIEFMPFSNNSWKEERMFDSSSIMEIISKKYKPEPAGIDSGPARNYTIEKGRGKISFISSMTEHFCSQCNRLRITSDGKMKLCLFSPENELLNLSAMLRDKTKTDFDIIKAIDRQLQSKEFEHRTIEELTELKDINMLKIGG
jgi:molybdenum cofactor biosynthesis protein A